MGVVDSIGDVTPDLKTFGWRGPSGTRRSQLGELARRPETVRVGVGSETCSWVHSITEIDGQRVAR